MTLNTWGPMVACGIINTPLDWLFLFSSTGVWDVEKCTPPCSLPEGDSSHCVAGGDPEGLQPRVLPACSSVWLWWVSCADISVSEVPLPFWRTIERWQQNDVLTGAGRAWEAWDSCGGTPQAGSHCGLWDSKPFMFWGSAVLAVIPKTQCLESPSRFQETPLSSFINMNVQNLMQCYYTYKSIS